MECTKCAYSGRGLRSVQLTEITALPQNSIAVLRGGKGTGRECVEEKWERRRETEWVEDCRIFIAKCCTGP